MRKEGIITKKVLALAVAASICSMVAACGSSSAETTTTTVENTADATQTQVEETTATEEAAESGVYTVETDNFESWDYSFVNINAFGDTAGVGMLNIQSWGNKKLALGDDGTCDGVGCKWTIKLEVNGTDYTLSTIAHIVGAGDVYDGEGDFSYIFTGTCEAADDGYVLSAPTAVTVDLAGNFTRLTDGSDFADYIPSAPVTITSDDADDCDAANAFKNKIVPSYLVSTVFGGATFHVNGSEIVEITDIDFPAI